MIRVIEFLRAARGWRRTGLALSAGMIAALSMPPHDLWPLLFIAIPVVLFMLEGMEREVAPALLLPGWCFGFGYFLVALHWIGFAFLVDAEDYLWMMPFAVGGLAAVMAVYWGLATFCVALSRREGLPVALVFAVSLAALNICAVVLFTGFPWAAPGLASDGMGAVAQTRVAVGHAGADIADCAVGGNLAIHAGSGPRPQRGFAALLIIATLPLCWAWGSYRLSQAAVANVDGVRIRIVQPNISQDSTNGGTKMPGRFLISFSRCRPAPRRTAHRPPTSSGRKRL